MKKLIVTFLLLMFITPCFAEGIRINSRAQCTTEGGTELVIDARSVILPEQDWERIELSLRELQDDRTRLTAENTSLKASLADPGNTWYWWLGLGLAAGAAATITGINLAK